MTAKTTTPAPTNFAIALGALTNELGTKVERDELAGYIAQLDEVLATVRAIRAQHAKAIAIEASKKSRAKKAARVAAGLALLEAAEAAAVAE